MPAQQQTLRLDPAALMQLATMLRSGSMKRTHTVKRLNNHTRIMQVGKFKEIEEDGKTTKKFVGFEAVTEELKEAFEITIPSTNGKPCVVVMSKDEMEHFKLSETGGLVDMDTGEAINLGGLELSLPIEK